MLVDDNLDAAEMLATLLRAAGHHVVHESTPAAALATAHDQSVDVFILDIGLPGMDGYELARRLRHMPAQRHALYIALTGYGQEEDKMLSKAAGFDHHFVKPINLRQLATLLA
jgi:CheY-like chemotaxis protein